MTFTPYVRWLLTSLTSYPATRPCTCSPQPFCNHCPLSSILAIPPVRPTSLATPLNSLEGTASSPMSISSLLKSHLPCEVLPGPPYIFDPAFTFPIPFHALFFMLSTNHCLIYHIFYLFTFLSCHQNINTTWAGSFAYRAILYLKVLGQILTRKYSPNIC